MATLKQIYQDIIVEDDFSPVKKGDVLEFNGERYLVSYAGKWILISLDSGHWWSGGIDYDGARLDEYHCRLLLSSFGNRLGEVRKLNKKDVFK